MTDTYEPTSQCDEHRQDAPISQAFYRVARAHRLVAGELLRQHGLYPGQEIMLSHLAQHGDQRQSALVLALSIDPSTVTKMLQRLERTGLVRRQPCPNDRRVSLVSITDNGRALEGQIAQCWRDLEERAVGSMSLDDRESFLRLLTQMERELTSRNCREITC